MANLYLLGGFPRDVSLTDLENYITTDLDVENLEYVWLDPRHERRAVFLCSSKHKLENFRNSVETAQLQNKALFIAEEKETSSIYVVVPSMRCKALVDKLPWLFHERKNGGSKVTDIMMLKENHYKLTFQDGWGAICKVVNSPWYIGHTEVKVTPFFTCFQEDYKMQKKQYLAGQNVEKDPLPDKPVSSTPQSLPQNSSQPPKPSVPKKPSEKGQKSISKALYLNRPVVALLHCLFLEDKCKEKFPMADVAIDVEEEKISFKGPKTVVNRLESMISEQFEIISDDLKDEFELFLGEVDQLRALADHFKQHKVFASLEDKNISIELFVMRDNKKTTLEEFTTSVIHVVHQFPYPETTPDKNKELLDFLTKFNEENNHFKLKSEGKNNWKLLLFDCRGNTNSEGSIMIVKIQKFLQDKTEPQRKVEVEASNKKKPDVKPKPSPKPKSATENLYIGNEYLLTLLNCLSLKEKIKQTYPSVEITVDVNDEKISLRGEPSIVEKLKNMLFSVCEDNDSKNAFRDELELFFDTEDHRKALIQLFQTYEIFARLEENMAPPSIVLFVMKAHQKMTFHEFTSGLLTTLREFKLPNADPDRDNKLQEYLKDFNQERNCFKLMKSGMNMWKLFLLDLHVKEGSKRNSVIDSVQSFLKEITEPPKKEKKEVESKSKDKNADLQKKTPVSLPKTANEALYLGYESHLSLLNCLSLKDKIQEKYSSIEITVDVDQEKISLKGDSSVVGKVKKTLVSLFEDMNSEGGSDKLDIFFGEGKDRLRIRSAFHHLSIHVEETDQGDISLFVQNDDDKRLALKDFIAKASFPVEEFSLSASDLKDSELREFLNKFNNDNILFQLKSTNHKWQLFSLKIDGGHALNLGKDIRSFLAMDKQKAKQESHSDDGDDEDVFKDATSNWPGKNQRNSEFTSGESNRLTKEFGAKAEDDDKEHWVDAPETNDHWHDREYSRDLAKSGFTPYASQGAISNSSKSGLDNSLPLNTKQARFLMKPQMVQDMKKKLKSSVTNLYVVGNDLEYLTPNIPDAFNAIQNYLLEIKSEQVTLNFPGVPEFYATKEGAELFSKTEQDNKCVISLPRNDHEYHRSGSHDDDKTEETKFKATLLRTFVHHSLHFYIVQSFGLKVTTDFSIHICPAESGNGNGGGIKDRGKGCIYLPKWNLVGETSIKREEKVEGLDQSLRTLLKTTGSVKSINISVSNKFDNAFPADVIARSVVGQIFKVFSTRQHSFHIFLCESTSVPLLKAYQKELSKWGICHNFNKHPHLTAEVSKAITAERTAPKYPADVNIEVAATLPFKMAGQGHDLVCYPIQSPLNIDKCPLKHDASHSWQYKRAMDSLEKRKPDGISVGEVVVLDHSPLDHWQVALYGCQEWDIGVNKALDLTLNNCLQTGMQYESLYIVIPGTTYPWNYPKEWLASKWFQYMDDLVLKPKMKSKMKMKGTIYFLISDPGYRQLFEQHLARRLPKTGLLKDIKDFFTGKVSKKKTESSEEASCDVWVTSRSKNYKQVKDVLSKKMKALMKENTVKATLSPEQHRQFRDIIKDVDTVNWKVNAAVAPVQKKIQGKGRGKQKNKNPSITKVDFEVQLEGLTKESVNVLGIIFSGSSVDKPVSGRRGTRNQRKGDVKTYGDQKWTSTQDTGGNEFNRGLEESMEFSGGDDSELEYSDRDEEPMETTAAGAVGGIRDDESQTGEQDSDRHDSGSSVHGDPKMPKEEEKGLLGFREQSEEKERQEANKQHEERQRDSERILTSKMVSAPRDEEIQLKSGTTGRPLGHQGEGDNNNSSTSYGIGGAGYQSPPTPSDDDIEDFEWAYFDDNCSFEFFDEDESEDLERAYSRGVQCLSVSRMDVRFSSMTATSKDDALKEFGVIRRESLPEKSSFKRPEHWSDQRQCRILRVKEEFKDIEESLLGEFATIGLEDVDFNILKIERIQNPQLFRRYTYKLKKTKPPNEKVMWQRLGPKLKSAVAEKGCEKAFFNVKRDGGELGDGIYFASGIKDCFNEEDVEKEWKIVLLRCKVCLGEGGKGSANLRYPPKGTTGEPVSSVSNESFGMIFSSAQVYPTHFVEAQFCK